MLIAKPCRLGAGFRPCFFFARTVGQQEKSALRWGVAEEDRQELQECSERARGLHQLFHPGKELRTGNPMSRGRVTGQVEAAAGDGILAG